jgi:hypothetical protein
LYRLLEAFDVRLGPGVKLVEQVGEGLRVGQVEAVDLLPVLVKDRLPGVLKDGVAVRVALLDLLGNLDIQIVVGVLGSPVAVLEVEVVAERTVGRDASCRRPSSTAWE